MLPLLNQESAPNILDRLNHLSAESAPSFGKMNASEMMKHCRIAMQAALGRVEVKANFIFKILFARWIRSKITNDEFYKPGNPTAKEFVTFDKGLSFEKERKELIETIEDFIKMSDSDLENTNHGLFGKMAAWEWRKSQWKHLDHHLKQFGC